jgi:hypothetical protein
LRTDSALRAGVALCTLWALGTLATGDLNDDRAVVLDDNLSDVVGELNSVAAVAHRVTSGRTRNSPRTTPYTMSTKPDWSTNSKSYR